MKNFSQIIRACLASIFLMAASMQMNAQSIVPKPTARCGTTVVYSANPGNILNPTYLWTVNFSSGGGTTGAGPSILVNLPNSPGTAWVWVSISGTEKIREQVYNPVTNRYEWEERYEDVTRYALTSTQIGDPRPSKPSTLTGPDKVCGNNATKPYTVSAVSGAGTYHWKVTSPYLIVHPTNSALLVSEYTGTQRTIQVRFPSSGSVSNGQVQVAAVSNGNCPMKGDYISRTVVFGPISPSMTGPSSIALTNVGRFTVSGTGLTNYSWSYPSGLSPISQTNTNSIVLEGLSATSGYVTATYLTCGELRSSYRYVTVSGSSGGGPGFGNPARPALEGELDKPTPGLYPNPASNVVTLSSERPLEQVIVVNVMGQVVKSLDQITGNTASIKLTGLKAGTYFVISLDSEGKHTQQLIVE